MNGDDPTGQIVVAAACQACRLQHLQQLHEDLTVHCLAYLDCRSLTSFGETSKAFRTLAALDELWYCLWSFIYVLTALSASAGCL